MKRVPGSPKSTWPASTASGAVSGPISSARREDSADTRYVQIGALAGPEAAVPSAAGTVSCWSKGRLPVSLVGILTVYG